MKKTLLAVLGGLALCGTAQAQSPNGYGTLVDLPVVVNSSTFKTEIFIHTRSGPTNISVTYFGGTGTPTGVIPCGSVALTGGQSGSYDLGALCGLSNAQSNFGRIRLQELSPDNLPFAAYARVQSFSGNGFSVEGFPVGNLAGSQGDQSVLGLRRQAAAPGYQTNCFMAALGEAVGVNWSLRNGTTNSTIGSGTTQALTANEVVRVLDVFTARGAPAGDYANVRANFSELGATEAGFVAYCTVQNNTSFDADFRIAKDSSPSDENYRYTASSSTDGLGAALTIASGTDQDIVGIHLRHPDWVACSVGGTQAAGLEMRMKDPSGAVVAGGGDLNSFGEFYLGDRNTRNGGISGLWTIEVESNGSPVTYPVTYNLTCTNGNGTHRPLLLGSGADTF